MVPTPKARITFAFHSFATPCIPMNQFDLVVIGAGPGAHGRLTLDCVKSEGSLGFAELGIEPSDVTGHIRYMEKYAKGGARGLFLQV